MHACPCYTLPAAFSCMCAAVQPGTAGIQHWQAPAHPQAHPFITCMAQAHTFPPLPPPHLSGQPSSNPPPHLPEITLIQPSIPPTWATLIQPSTPPTRDNLIPTLHPTRATLIQSSTLVHPAGCRSVCAVPAPVRQPCRVPGAGQSGPGLQAGQLGSGCPPPPHPPRAAALAAFRHAGSGHCGRARGGSGSDSPRQLACTGRTADAAA